ncbi:MAG: transcription antitermination factor NusB [Chitinophagales bacterium]
MQTIYATDQGATQDLYSAEKVLRKNLKQTLDLFYYQLLTICEITDFSLKYAEIIKSRHIKLDLEERHYTKIEQHPFVLELKENEHFKNYVKNNKLAKFIDEGIIRELFRQLHESHFYKNYMLESGEEVEKEVLLKLYKDVMLTNERYQAHLEENFTYFDEDNSSVRYRLTDLLETPESLKNSVFFDRLYDKSDADFAIDLLNNYRNNHQDFEALIKPQLKNWDIQRIARLDIILIKLALCELLHFDNIPVKVSINEYIDISKLYSTPKSHEFVNGVIDRLRKKLEKEKKIKKSGRGLLS